MASHTPAIRSRWRAIALSPPAVFSMSSGILRSVASTALRQLSKPIARVVVVVDVAAVDDQALGADLGGGVHVLLEQLAARDPDPVVRGRDVDEVGRVDVEVDAGRLGVGAQRRRRRPRRRPRGPCSTAGCRGRTARAARRGPRPRRSGRSARRGRRRTAVLMRRPATLFGGAERRRRLVGCVSW